MNLRISARLALLLMVLGPPVRAASAELNWIRVSDDKKGFVQQAASDQAGQPGVPQKFVPWGVNYDHDVAGRLIEDYWDAEWPLIEQHFAAIRELKANTVRLHLQFGKFMDDATTPNTHAHRQLRKVVELAEKSKLYLDLTGLGCYHKQDVPAWYDDLSEQQRWDAQAVFWQSVAETCRNSPAIFCYDLMNEPVVPGGKRNPKDWLGPAFAGKHFVQCISLDQAQRPRSQIAADWLRHLTRAIRKVDDRHLITVGLVDWSLDRPGLTSGFIPATVADQVDFLCVHLYPETGKTAAALETLAGFSVGKPVVIEEIFPLKCNSDELATFIQESKGSAAGWISFYWGRPLAELRKSNEIGDAIQLQWLQRFENLSSFMVP